jgi:small subunit ribosomal protein S6
MLNLEAKPETLAEYERIMGLNEDVLRFMNIAVDKVEEDPSIMMQVSKPERGGRGDRGDRSSAGRNTETRNETADDAPVSTEQPLSEDNTEE